MSQLDVRQLRQHCVRSNALLLDVREPWEVELAAIRLPGVVHKNIPLTHIPERMSELDASQSIVCICHHGVRSLQVVAFLQRHGFESVYNLAGGIDAWSAEVDPTVPRY
jgi:rhodanese-related sulfurtransferase